MSDIWGDNKEVCFVCQVRTFLRIHDLYGPVSVYNKKHKGECHDYIDALELRAKFMAKRDKLNNQEKGK